ncbi:MAG: hypothetical protein WKF37_19960, partial [Bryobacteraceae bacterium]
AKALYYIAVEGSRDAAIASSRIFEKMYSQNPDSSGITAYLGSLRLMEASRTLAIWRKGRLANEGLSLLDRAVARGPDDLEVRFVLSATTYHLPPFFKREEQCLESQRHCTWLGKRC